MTPQEADVTLQLLQRITLKPEEIGTFNHICSVLMGEKNPPKDPEPKSNVEPLTKADNKKA